MKHLLTLYGERGRLVLLNLPIPPKARLNALAWLRELNESMRKRGLK